MITSSRKSILSVVMRACVIAVLGAAIVAPLTASAMIEPVSDASDPRIKTITFGQDMVYKYTGYLKFQSIIEFGQGETIGTISMGDPTAWKLNASGQKLYIKPIDLDAVTNMTILTNKRTYFFELHAEEAKDISDPRITFILRFAYPDDGDGSILTNSVGNDRVPDLESEDLSKYNFRYSITGNEDISPIRIFDDGEFTFFEFRGINADIPAFFKVEEGGDEQLINYRTRGNYIVVERVSGRYTLRLGKKVVCVFNEAWGSSPAPKKSGGWFSGGGDKSAAPTVK